MKLLLAAVLAILSQNSLFAGDVTEHVVCVATLNSAEGLSSVDCLPKGYAQTDVIFPLNSLLQVMNKNYSVELQRAMTVKYFKDFGIELRSEAVYPNPKANKKDQASFTTKLTFTSIQPIFLQKYE